MYNKICTMALVSKAAKKVLDLYKGIEDKQSYAITDHTGANVTLSGKDLKAYITAHRRFISIDLEQQVTELTKKALKNKN